MSEITDMLSKYNQIQMLVWWLSENTKYKVISNFDGRAGELVVKVYDGEESTKASNIYKVENMWVKAESIALKELRNVSQQLLFLKESEMA